MSKTKIIIHVNRHIALKNKKHNTDLPCIAIRKGKAGKPLYVNSVKIKGESELIYNKNNPLPCGATLWLECDQGTPLEIEILKEEIQNEA